MNEGIHKVNIHEYLDDLHTDSIQRGGIRKLTQNFQKENFIKLISLKEEAKEGDSNESDLKKEEQKQSVCSAEEQRKSKLAEKRALKK